jgi:hypothetical protein
VIRKGVAKVFRVGTRADLTRFLENITGDFVAVMNADDFLSADALQMIAHAIENNPGGKLFYSDEYEADATSVRKSPFFKPDFDPVLLMNFCYLGQLLAIETQLLRQVGAYADLLTFSSDDCANLWPMFGEEPIHVRELSYARRVKSGATACARNEIRSDPTEVQRLALSRFLSARGLDAMLSIASNPLNSGTGLWRVVAREPLPNVKVFDAREVWGETQINVAGLVSAAGEPGSDWLAILLEPHDPRGLLELSAVGWLDPRINAVCGLLTDPNERVVRWSGGLFLPGGRLFDPYAGKALSEGGYHTQLWCQRCIDVPAPVNVLIRSKSLIQAAARIPAGVGADGLMVMLGLAAQEDAHFIAVTPHLRDVHPPAAIAIPPMDRHGLLLGAPALEKGSRWYDGRLRPDPAYGLWDLA